MSDNRSGFGGGIHNIPGSTVTVEDGSRVTGNTAVEYGGGIFNAGGTLTLRDGSWVTGNTSYDGGGGVSNYGGTVTLQEGSRVTGNTANAGGGIYIQDGGTVTVAAGALVCDNMPANDQCSGVPTNCPAPGAVCPPEIGRVRG